MLICGIDRSGCIMNDGFDLETIGKLSKFFYKLISHQSTMNLRPQASSQEWTRRWMKRSIVLRCTCPSLPRSWIGEANFCTRASWEVSTFKILVLSFYHSSCRGSFTVVPVLVGFLDAKKEAEYGRIFSKYLTDPANLFIISSDFCHWGVSGTCPHTTCTHLDTYSISVIHCSHTGKRFKYTWHNKKLGPIQASIEALDKMVKKLL